ncbi:alkaline phosphatase [Aeoliella sp. ICT_H6.2]|uniref:Alkaline phosphatase n=1 Tax=Aeoliella straminimaris TaxID=2954799 RepID=A0A9X2FDL5_9BACT|nr:alkaline phosphatase [Aeoliella straminimaris]
MLSTMPTNIILMIGDGMGPEQVEAGRYLLDSSGDTPLSFETLPYQAEMTTYSADNSVTDSAASATAMATGQKVNNGVISLAYPGDGSELQTSLEIHQLSGKATGLVSTAYITHATPAAFGAHESSRNNTGSIADDFLSQTLPNVLLGGGANGMSASAATNAGYTVVTTADEMQVLTGTEVYVSGQFGSSHLPYEYDGLDDLPHLSEMTGTALDLVDNDPDGFFLMVEGGRIDHAGHDNDLPRLQAEVVEFSNAVQTVIDWVDLNSNWTDTLLIVTADHETGGLDFNFDTGTGSFSTTGHTAANVPVYAWGAGAESVIGTLDNTDVFSLTTVGAFSTVEFQQGVNSYSGTFDTNLFQDPARADTSYATATQLNVDSDEPSGSGDDAQVLLRFADIFGTGAGQVPLDAQLVSARLELQVSNPGNSLNLHQMLTSWDDTDTWNSRVAGIQADGTEAAGWADASTGAVATGTLLIDVTSSLAAWQADPTTNHGWAVLSSGTDGVDFDSAEGPTQPKLVVSFQPGTGNSQPVANADAVTLDEGAMATTLDGGAASVLDNDTDADPGDTLTINTTPIVAPQFGDLVLKTDGTFSYTHNGSENFSDSFTYEVHDGAGGADTATVLITVTPVNDNTPIAVADSATVTEGGTVTLLDSGEASVQANDSDADLPGDTLTAVLDTGPAFATDFTLNADGTFSYTHDGSENLSDSFSYHVNDGLHDSNVVAVTVAVAPAVQRYFAASETSVFGTVAGSYVDTQAADDRNEQITEEIYGGKRSRLEHVWDFGQVDSAQQFVFEGYRTALSADDFQFEYSTDGVNWTTMIASVATTESVHEYQFGAPISGAVQVRVVDTDRSKESTLDMISIDEMYFLRQTGPVLPTVSLVTTDDTAVEDVSDPGTFTVTRSGDVSGDLVVSYVVDDSSTATASDYQETLTGSVTIPDGSAEATITITPVNDGQSEGIETLTLVLVAGDYTVASPDTATIAIHDTAVVPDNVYTSGESTVLGEVISGDHSATLVDDGLYEVIQEELLSRGQGKSQLEHIWTFDLAQEGDWTFFMEAYDTGSNDHFEIQYSLDQNTWTTMFTVDNSSPDDMYSSGPLTITDGLVYVRAIDTNRSNGETTLDALYVDQMFFSTSEALDAAEDVSLSLDPAVVDAVFAEVN